MEASTNNAPNTEGKYDEIETSADNGTLFEPIEIVRHNSIVYVSLLKKLTSVHEIHEKRYNIVDKSSIQYDELNQQLYTEFHDMSVYCIHNLSIYVKINNFECFSKLFDTLKELSIFNTIIIDHKIIRLILLHNRIEFYEHIEMFFINILSTNEQYHACIYITIDDAFTAENETLIMRVFRTIGDYVELKNTQLSLVLKNALESKQMVFFEAFVTEDFITSDNFIYYLLKTEDHEFVSNMMFKYGNNVTIEEKQKATDSVFINGITLDESEYEDTSNIMTAQIMAMIKRFEFFYQYIKTRPSDETINSIIAELEQYGDISDLTELPEDLRNDECMSSINLEDFKTFVTESRNLNQTIDAIVAKYPDVDGTPLDTETIVEAIPVSEVVAQPNTEEDSNTVVATNVEVVH